MARVTFVQSSYARLQGGGWSIPKLVVIASLLLICSLLICCYVVCFMYSFCLSRLCCNIHYMIHVPLNIVFFALLCSKHQKLMLNWSPSLQSITTWRLS